MRRQCAIFLAAGLVAVSGRAWGDDVMKGIEMGPETTLVKGPLSADGGIDYVWAANEVMGKGIDPKDNAAAVLIEAVSPGKAPYELPEVMYRELGVPVVVGGGLVPLHSWATEHAEEAGDVRMEQEMDWSMATEGRPWKGEEYPVVAKWLKDEGKYLDMAEEASKRGKYYAPMASTVNPPSMVEALKHRLDVPLLAMRAGLTARAYERIGEGDVAGTLRDLRTMQRLGRLTVHDLDIGSMQSAVFYSRAMQGERWIALSSAADKKMLGELADGLGAEYAAETFDRAERFYGLDEMADVMRGREMEWLRWTVGDYSEKNTVADEDLRGADWNVVMRAFNKRMDRMNAVLALPRGERKVAAEKMREEEKAAGLPMSLMENLLAGKEGTEKEQWKKWEDFLKRGTGESREDYSGRMAMLFTGDMAMTVRLTNLMLRPVAEQRLTRTTIALAEYKLDKGEWPEKLESLVPTYLAAVPVDPYSDGGMKYRREGSGFLLYSVGVNETDEGGAMGGKTHADDMAVTAEKGVGR